jgi:hypothetical protein
MICFTAVGANDTGYITLRPGEDTNVTLMLLNGGDDAYFRLTASAVTAVGNFTDFLEYRLDPEMAFVGYNLSTEIVVQIGLLDNAADGLAATFTIVAQSIYQDNVNNFITIDMVATTMPPPEFTENVSIM